MPNIPLGQPISDENGNLTPQWDNFMRALYHQGSQNFNENGLHAPPLKTNELSPDNREGAIYFNTDTKKFEGYNDNGERVEFTTTPL